MSRAGREDGFTLIELLVSLTILSVSLAVMFSAISSALTRNRQERNAVIASSLVQSLLSRTGVERPLQAGDFSGVYSNGFRWRVTVRPYGDKSDRDAWHVSAFVVRVTVNWNEGSFVKSDALSAVRIVPPEKTS